MSKKNFVSCLGICFFLFVLVISFSLVNASKSQEVSGRNVEIYDFDILSSRTVQSGEFSEISPEGVEVILNEGNLGVVSSGEEISSEDFISGKNIINFSSKVNFSLTYNYTVGEGGSCSQDNECTTGDCVKDKCCSEEYPINVYSSISSMCQESYIPIVPEKKCDGITSSDKISIYLGNNLIDEDCDISGDTGWGLNEGNGYVERCGVKVPSSVSPGEYKLRAEYNIEGEQYEIVLGSNFEVTNDCDVNSRCGHGGGIVKEGINIGELSEESGEIFRKYENDYIVPEGSILKYSGITAYTTQCSDGYRGDGNPIVVSWVDKIQDEGFRTVISENIEYCDIDSPIENLIGDVSSIQGYNPGRCTFPWNFGGKNEFVVSDMTSSGKYVIKTRNVGAVCDSPSYICPDLFSGETDRSNICKVGTMSDWGRADGWDYIEDNEVLVIGQEDLNVVFSLGSVGNNFWGYDVENLGIVNADVSISNIGQGQDFEIDCSSGSCEEEVEAGGNSSLYFGSKLNAVNNESKTEDFGGKLGNFQYSVLTMNNYEKNYTKGNEIHLTYDLEFEYDDAYGFDSLGPFTETKSPGVNISYVCNGSEKYVLNLSGEEYYCFGNNFQNNPPYAWIVEPEQNENIYGNTSNFSAIAFDDSTDFNDLVFSWFFREDDVLEEFPEEPYYQALGGSGSNFSRYFSWKGDKQVMLKVSDSENNVKEDIVNFSLLFEGQFSSVPKPACSEDGSKWIIPDGKDISSMNQCRDKNSSNIILCCPRNHRCLEDEGNWSCIPQNSNDTSDSDNIDFCSQYNSENNCTNDPDRVGIFSVESAQGDGFCGSYDSLVGGCTEFNTGCGCVWNNTEDQCYSDYSVQKDCPSTTRSINLGKCKIESQTLSSCEQGASLYEVKYFYSWQGDSAPENCIGEKTRKIPCPSKIKLPFTNHFSLLIGFLSILGIYYLVKKDRVVFE